MNLLLVGLERVDNSSNSLACQCVSNCAAVDVAGHTVESLSLPALWDGCFEPLDAALDDPWDAIVILSERVSDSITIERIAINEADISQKDVQGRRPRMKTIEKAGDPGYWTSLPYRQLANRLTSATFPAVPSHSAGMAFANFVCYKMMHGLVQRGCRIPAGLLQLPFMNPAFEEKSAQRFLSVLIGTLDPNRYAEDSLRIDLPRAADRLSIDDSSR